MNTESETDEGLKIAVAGHLLIRDSESGEILLNQRDTLGMKTQENTDQKGGNQN